jgi:hypothetical protein
VRVKNYDILILVWKTNVIPFHQTRILITY